MKFWDTSALAPLIVDEPTTPAIRRLLAQDAEVVVWMLTSVELLSVLGRLGRTATSLDDLIPTLRSDATSLLRHVATVTDVDGVRRRAERLVGVHPLAAADAMQLGAALVACGDRPERLTFVTLDKTLGRSAQLEGFRVLLAAHLPDGGDSSAMAIPDRIGNCHRIDCQMAIVHRDCRNCRCLCHCRLPITVCRLTAPLVIGNR